MTYRVDRALGYEAWGVVNPWVFANYGQPQRGRGYVSPMVFKTHPPRRGSHYLGQVDDPARGARMERLAIIGTVMSGVSLSLYAFMAYRASLKKNRVRRNRGKR